MSYKLDIFEVLKKIEQKDRTYFFNLPAELKRAFAPIVVMRWLTGNSDALQIYQINMYANKYVFSLSKDPELIYLVLTACSSGNQHRNKWMPKKSQSNKLRLSCIAQMYSISSKDALNYVDKFSPDEFVSFAQELGWTKEETKKLQEECTK